MPLIKTSWLVKYFNSDSEKKSVKLNENDNTGARYLLMAIYAYLEEEKEMLKLYKYWYC